jgi:UDP-N-acetylglucosamine/UDP-N-acetylgalactosamine diphosphorylase
MENTYAIPEKILELMEKGVKIPTPYSVDIGSEVDTGRISGKDVIFYGGTKIYGEKTLIGPGTKLGYESPVTVVDCRLGLKVELKGGFFKKAVFLDRSNMGSGAHVREGSILEEEANGGHTVGLKQTILFPFVTIGSLVNFCDGFMAGGTSRKDHSEVGSSYIHFNYTPNQDKATASLIGDVPRGVMLNQPPIFLGGQGGLVGPSRIGYGTVIAAGTIYRGDSPQGGELISASMESASTKREFWAGYYGEVDRRIENNILYIANLLALKEWYRHVRKPFFYLNDQGPALYEAVLDTLESAVTERLNRFKSLADKMVRSIEITEEKIPGEKGRNLIARKKNFIDNWGKIEQCLASRQEEDIACDKRDTFRDMITKRLDAGETDYIKTIQSLDPEESSIGTEWLQAIVDRIHRDGSP